MSSGKKFLNTLVQLLISCITGGLAVAWIAVPNGLAVTGTTGLAMALSTFIPLDYTLIYYLITVIVSILAWIFLGKEEVAKILALSILFPLTMYLARFVPITLVFEDKLIATAMFGILFGISYGSSYRNNFSYGASDTVGKILVNTCMKKYTLNQVMNVVEGFIVFVLLFVYDINLVAYALIGEIIYVQVMNILVNHSKGGKTVMVRLVFSTENEKALAFAHSAEQGCSAQLMKLENGSLRVEYLCAEVEASKSVDALDQSGVAYELTVFPVVKNIVSAAR